MTNDSTIAPQDTGSLGIENFKAFITALAGQVRAAATIDANQDGTISTSEWTGFGTGFVLAMLANFSVARDAFPEAGDIKGAEFGELTAHVLATDFLPDDKDSAEDLVKTILLAAQVNRLLVSGIVKMARGEEYDIDLFDLFKDSLTAGA